MKRKQVFALLTVLAMLVSMLVGCGGTPESTGPSTSEQPGASQENSASAEGTGSNKEITVVHWQHHHEARTPAVESIVKMFEEENKGIKVSFEAIPYDSYQDKLNSSIASGVGPDTFQIYGLDAPQMIKNERLMPVPESVMTASQIREDFLEWTVANGLSDGKYYGLPTDVQSVVLFINNKLYREAGFDPAAPPKDWDEFLAQAKAGTKFGTDGKMVQAGMDTRYKWAYYTTFLYQATGGNLVDLANKKVRYDTAEGIRGWEMIKKILVDEKVDSAEFMTGQFKFELGKAMFYLNHPVTVGRIKQMAPDMDYTIAQVPGPAGTKPMTVGSNWLYTVNADSKQGEAAWKWVKYLASEKAQMTFIEQASDLPSMKSLLDKTDLFTDANGKAIKESLKLVVPAQEVSSAEIDPIRDAIYTKIALGQASVEAAVKDGAAEENAVMEKLTK
jgi:multiple sugar transport system substrate-binding protein